MMTRPLHTALCGVVLLLLYAGLPAQAWAQVDPAARIAEIREAYQRLDYEAAEAGARAVLADHQHFTPDQLTTAHTLLGLIAYARNEPQAARQEFEAALQLTPDLQLDPLLVSPKILAFFEEVRAEMRQAEPSGPAADPSALRYVVVRDPRVDAALRSAAWPGWGQLYKGETLKGRVLAGGWGTLLAGAAAAHLLRGRAAERYHDETDPARIEARYATFNTWHKVRNNVLLGAGALWLYSYVDALLFRDAADAPAGRLALTPALTPEAVHLTVRVRF